MNTHSTDVITSQAEVNANIHHSETAEVQSDTSVSAQATNHVSVKRKSSNVFGILVMIAAVVVLSLGLRTFVLQPFEIPSGSMEETIMPGDRVFAERVSYYFSEPKAGEIVTFTDPNDASRTLIKRCIATAGQTVNLKDGVVYVDGEALSEHYTNEKPSYPLNSTVVDYPYTVPEGCIWVMGDNRTSSQDSRFFGAVSINSVSGHAFFTYWPLNRLGLLK